MQTLFRRHARFLLSAFLVCLIGVASGRAPMFAQVLAQPNWAGSGVTVEPWWQRAVFYRIDPAKFQDSTGDGRGDLAGVRQRLDYLQTLGVDALILESTPGLEGDAGASPMLSPGDPAGGFDDLVRAAVDRHLRVLVELGAPVSQNADAAYVETARAWLNQGAAGVYVPTRALEKVDGAEHIALLLQELRTLTDSFPGGRVLLADAPSTPDEELLAALAKETQLTASAAMVTTTPTAASLRAQLTAALENGAASSKEAPARHERHVAASTGGNPLLVAARVPEGTNPALKMGLERALAVMLLASRGAVMLEYGQELGLDAAGKNEPLMQWTPRNLKAEPKPPAAKPAKAGPAYGTFQSYVPPLPRDLFPPPPLPDVEESFELTPVLIDPNTLRGFTTGTIDAAMEAPNGATANVGTEQNDPWSLLHLYRQLIQLHHDDDTVRNGSETLLDYDAVDAVVLVRRAPASSRTSSSVLAACNLSDTPVTLHDVGVSLYGLRSLLHPWPSGALWVVAPGAVLVGEAR